MPQDPTLTTNDPPAGETPPADFETWLKSQPEEVQKRFEDHTAGLKNALNSEREKKRELEKAEKDRKANEQAEAEKRLKEQGEYKQLAEQHAAKIAELETQLAQLAPATERVKVLETALGKYLAKEREGLPPHILALLDSLSVDKQLEYITNNRQALKPAAPTGAIPPTPPATTPGQLSDEERRKRSWQPRM
jgi:myosin heavy subunit